MSFWDELIDLLSAHQADPATYLLIFFLFCILAAVALPIPIEIFLVIDPSVPFVLKALVMGLGKGTGAFAVYYIGYEIDVIASRAARWRNLASRVIGMVKDFIGHHESLSRVAGKPWFRDMLSSQRKLVHGRRRGGIRSWGWIRWLMRKSDAFVRRYGYPAMFLIMAIPGMVDTVPLYVFSILNKEGQIMTLKGFVITNILAGITRAGLIYLIFYGLGIEIF
ncbi:MAG TPA: hypothetical protein VF374_03920 [Thermoplasmata archaeon]